MSLLNLPPEIWNAVESHLNDEDRRQLCQTCHRLMSHLQQKAYRYVILDDSVESGRGVLALASGPRAKFVHRIQYSPFDPMPIDGWGEEDRESEHDGDITLSDETRMALESLHLFVGLKRFRLILDHWKFGDWPGTPFSLSSYSFDEHHLPHDVEPWRILLEESFVALSKSAGAFSKLEIQNLPPIPDEQPYKALETDKWKSLLQKLTSLKITLLGIGDCGMGSLTTCHQGSLNSFPHMFLNHLPNLEHLRIAGHEDGTIGHYDDKEPIDWESLRMPRLRTFELEYSSLGGSLVTFLVNHSDTLERLYLRHCLGVSKKDWKDLFQGFVEKNSTRLVELRIIAYPVPKRSYYPDDDEWRHKWENMLTATKRMESKADEAIFFDDTDDNLDRGVESQQQSEVDRAMSALGAFREARSRKENTDEDRDGKDDLDSKEEGESQGMDESGDEGEGDNNGDESDGGEDYWKRDKMKYVENPKPWEEVVVDDKRRRFVVAETCESYGQIQPVELYGEWEEDSDLDESDVVEIWQKLEQLLQRNRAMLRSAK